MEKFHLKIFFLFSFFISSTCFASSLEQALTLAYKNNPVIEGERSSLRSLDEDVSSASSKFLPRISISTSYGESSLNYGEANEIKLKPKVSKIEARQILFAGGRLVNNRLQSVNTVKAGRANLRIVEQDILFTAADAFFGVLKSKKIIELMESNFQILTERLVVTKIQFDVGELTLTDVAQSEARLALAQADLLEARAKLKISNANYKAIIGNEPNNLLEYKKNIKLPDTVDDAILIAERNSPLLHFAEKTEKSSKYGLASARSMLSPVVSIQGEFSNSKEVFMRDYNGDSYQITGSVSMPLFAGGLNWSNIRKAQELNNKDRYFLVESKRLIKKEIKTAFAEYESSLSRIISTQKQVDANEIALEGVKIEFELGTRTNLDVLDAERERLDSQVSLINAKK
jgi:TolC family type I secretion outer membrane protein